MEFSAGVHNGESLVMNVYHLSVDLVLNTDDDVNHNIAYNRIRYFINAEIDSTIFINLDLTDQCLKLRDAGLNITTLPLDPIDQAINVMLFHKFNAIMEERLIVMESTIQNSNGGNVIYFYNSNEDGGPYSNPGWWNEANLVHCDPSLQGKNVVNMQHSAIWRDLDLQWPSESVTPDDSSVVVAKFRRDD